jgi:hypothetical protein
VNEVTAMRRPIGYRRQYWRAALFVAFCRMIRDREADEQLVISEKTKSHF